HPTSPDREAENGISPWQGTMDAERTKKRTSRPASVSESRDLARRAGVLRDESRHNCEGGHGQQPEEARVSGGQRRDAIDARRPCHGKQDETTRNDRAKVSRRFVDGR